jgi:hypothetical protein
MKLKFSMLSLFGEILMKTKCIAVDLDGTLAGYQSGDYSKYGPTYIYRSSNSWDGQFCEE